MLQQNEVADHDCCTERYGFASKLARTLRRILRFLQNAKHEQPNAPQNPAKSLTGAFDKRARSWLWECTAHGPPHW